MILKLTLITLVLSTINLNGSRGVPDKLGFAVPDTVTSNELSQDHDDYPVRGEIRQTYKIAPNANIDVSGIEGSVEVETTNGTAVELHFVREARSQTDYDCETIVVEDSALNLVVRHQTKKEKQCRMIQAREHLKLVVPRSANLNFKHIEGAFSVGATDGFLRLSWIEGSVRIGQTQAAEISWIESGLSLSVAQVGPQGINVRNIEGPVDLGITDKVNADLRLSRYSGNVQIDIPNAQPTTSGRKDYQLRLGTGGAGISLSGIEGGVRIRGI